MQGETSRPLAPGWLAWAGGTAAAVILALGAWLESPGYRTSTALDWVTGVTVVVASAGIGVLLATRRGENPVGWLLLVLALSTAHFALTEGYVSYALAHPDTLPGDRLVANWDRAAWALIFAPILAIVFLFPAGTPPLRRWTIVKRGTALAFTAVTAAGFLAGKPLNKPFDSIAPFDVLPATVGDVMFALGLGGLVIAFVLAAVSIRRRFRGADSVTRAQLKWLVYTSALIPLSISTGVVEVAFSASGEPGIVTLTLLIALLILLPVSIGVALMRYRLFDIDVVINRTLVYGTLTVCVAGGYVAVVAGLDGLLGSRGFAGVLAAAAVVVAVQPLRERLQRGVDHWLYGYRSDPYQAMRLLGERLDAALAPGDVLQTIVASVAESLRLPFVAVEFERDGELEIAATCGELGRAAPTRQPLLHQGEQVAELVVGVPAGRDLTPADRRLLDDLAAQAGVAVHAVRLTADLQHSRERLVSAREEERRRVRRDLHDGLGPTLAAAVLGLDASRRAVADDPALAEELLTGLRGQMQDAIADVRRLVYELRPPALDELGLVGALREHAARMSDHNGGPKMTVDATGEVKGLPAAVEVAAYRIAMEAMNNAHKHAGARRCTVQLERGGGLGITIADDGAGVGTDAPTGVGMQSMRERARELGGTFAITGRECGGTIVTAHLPVNGS